MDAAQLVSGLGVLLPLQENTLRIEILCHLVATCCQGHAKPKASDLSDWIGKFMIDSPAALLEDPAEDMFIGCVNVHFGSFRIFQGIFADGAFLSERLLDFYEKKTDFPTFQETIDRALALLQLSDALAERAGLQRYCVGPRNAAQRITIPRWKEFEPRIRSTFFSHEDLIHLGINKSLLEGFTLDAASRARLSEETLFASSLERKPLLGVNGGILVFVPSTISRALVRFMTERMKIMGGWGETFYQQDNATLFVNNVGSLMEIEQIEESPPHPEDGNPLTFPFFGYFDYGKPVMMFTYTPPLDDAIANFGGIDQLTSQEQTKFQRYLETCATQLEKLPGFLGGMVLICIAGYGRGFRMLVHQWSSQWRVHVAPLRDWISLTSDRDFTAMQLWKLDEQDAIRRNLGIKLTNPSGLPNLVAFWKQTGFRLIPKEMDIRRSHNLIVISSDFVRKIFVEDAQQRDEHCIKTHDGGSWVRIIRHTSRSLFSDDNRALIYAAVNEAHHQLVGCTKRGAAVWWVIAPEHPDREELRDLLYQLWDCILSWADHIVTFAEREWPVLRKWGIEIRLAFPDFAHWTYGDRGTNPPQPADLWIATDQRDYSITITIPEGFLRHFNVPKNVAERRIVAGIFDGAARLAGEIPVATRTDNLAREVMRNEDARYFHIIQRWEIEQFIARGRRPRPLFVPKEDMMLAELGLADLVGRPNESGLVTGLDACRQFLEDTVTKIWERIETRLRRFDRSSVIGACFRALDEITRDEAHWNLTTRSLFALHTDESEIKTVLRDRRSERSAATLSNRLLIENAQYACPDNGGAAFTRADHQALLADATLLVTFAHHRDAIAFGFLKPEVKIHPNGEVDVDLRFYDELLHKYLSHRSDTASQKAAEDYDKHFEVPEQFSEEKSRTLDETLAKLDKVFVLEFGFPVEGLFKLVDALRYFAIESESSVGALNESEIVPILCNGCGFTTTGANAFLDRLTLPIRSGWDTELPPGCKKEDVYPWRFRRNLSLLVRPLVQIGKSPRSWLVSASFFEKSVAYLLGHVEQADLPERFFRSDEMKSYIGKQVNKRGHAFAEIVNRVFSENAFTTRLEIEMSALGASKNDGLGDIDVLGWDVESGMIFPVECKRLLPALTVREIIQRLEDFRGDRKAKDSLGRHLRRIDWLTQNLNSLVKFTGIEKDRIQLKPILVTSDVVPMQFFAEMNFPPDQVIPIVDLPNFLAGQRKQQNGKRESHA